MVCLATWICQPGELDTPPSSVVQYLIPRVAHWSSTWIMNSALYHAARPGDICDSRGRKCNNRMREVAAVAKQMGLDRNTVEGSHVDKMWKMLDSLAAKDSAAYHQMARQGRDQIMSQCKTQARGDRFFTPAPGFVVKASLRRPWTPAPGGTRKITQEADAGTKVFVNVCGHEGVSLPVDQANREVDSSTESRDPSGLRMPMAVSAVRETKDHQDERALALDVVFHPWVLRCSREPRFRNQVVDLALRWAMDEHSGLTVCPKWKVLKMAKYKGGEGLSGGEPIPFPVSDACIQSEPVGDRGSPVVPGSGGRNGSSELLDPSMRDPQSLLAAVKESSASCQGRDGIREAKDPSAAQTQELGSTQGNGHRYRGCQSLLDVGDGSEAVDPEIREQGELLERDDDEPPLDIRLPGSLTGTVGRGRGASGRGNADSKDRGPLISEIPEVSDGAKIPGIERAPEQPEMLAMAASRAPEKKVGGAGGQEGHGIGTDLVEAVDQAKETECRKERGARDGFARGPAVKKGFLSKLGDGKSSPLYPKGGSENGAEAGTYAKLMDRCKVVDTSTMSKEQVNAAMRSHAGGSGLGSPEEPESSAPSPPGTDVSVPTSSRAKKKAGPAVRKGFLQSQEGGSLYGDEGSREGGGVRRGSAEAKRKIDRKFEELVADADPDMGSAQMSEDAEDPVTEQLAHLAKILGPSVAPFPKTYKDSTRVTSSTRAERSDDCVGRSPSTAQNKIPPGPADINLGEEALGPANAPHGSVTGGELSSVQSGAATSLSGTPVGLSEEDCQKPALKWPSEKCLSSSSGRNGSEDHGGGNNRSRTRQRRQGALECSEGSQPTTSGLDAVGVTQSASGHAVDPKVSPPMTLSSSRQLTASGRSMDESCVADGLPRVAALHDHHGGGQPPGLPPPVDDGSDDHGPDQSEGSTKDYLSCREEVDARAVTASCSSGNVEKTDSTSPPSPRRERAWISQQDNVGSEGGNIGSVPTPPAVPTAAGASSALLPSAPGDAVVPAGSVMPEAVMTPTLPGATTGDDVAEQLRPGACVSSGEENEIVGTSLREDSRTQEDLVVHSNPRGDLHVRERRPSPGRSTGRETVPREGVEDAPGTQQSGIGREGTEREPLYRMEVIPADPTTVNGKRRVIVVIEVPEAVNGRADEPPTGGKDPGSGGDVSGVPSEKGTGQQSRDSITGDAACSGSSRGAASGKNARDIASEFELDVTSKILELRVPGLYKLVLEMPFSIDADGVVARFSKLRAGLCIIAWER